MTQSLAAMIEAAFAPRTRPEGPIVPDRGHCSECERTDAAIRGRRWQELTPHEMFHHRDALHLMTADAYLYYLPGFAIEALSEHPGAADVQGTVVFSMTMPDTYPGANWLDYVRPRMCGATFEERATMIAFLRHFEGLRSATDVQDYGAIIERLHAFWNTHCGVRTS